MEFKEIYDNYSGTVYSYLKFKIKDSYLVEDILQDTFLCIYKELYKLRDVENIKSYVLKIAHRRMVDKLRKLNNFEVNIDDINENQVIEETPFDNLLVKDMLKILDSTSRTIIYGIYIEKLSYKELSEMLELPEGTIKSKCFYAKRKLRDILREEYVC